MTKQELVSIICNNTGLEREEVSVTVDSLLEAIKQSLARGESVTLRGFGNFINKYRGRKVARNISTGEEVILEPHYTPAFKPSDAFIDVVKRSHFIGELEKVKTKK